MYAVIRAGGKQYRVAPGDVIEIEKLPQSSGENVQCDDVLAVSASEGEIAKPAAAFVSGQVVEQGRGDKILSGMAIMAAKTRGATSCLMGERPSTSRASICSLKRMEPS